MIEEIVQCCGPTRNELYCITTTILGQVAIDFLISSPNVSFQRGTHTPNDIALPNYT